MYLTGSSAPAEFYKEFVAKCYHFTTYDELLNYITLLPNIRHEWLAAMPGIPKDTAEILFSLYKDTTRLNSVVIFLAQNASTPPNILHELSQHDDWTVYIRVAGNPSASLQTIESIIDRTNVAANYHYAHQEMAALRQITLRLDLTDALVRKIYNLNNPTVRECLAVNCRCLPQDIKAMLALEF